MRSKRFWQGLVVGLAILALAPLASELAQSLRPQSTGMSDRAISEWVVCSRKVLEGIDSEALPKSPAKTYGIVDPLYGHVWLPPEHREAMTQCLVGRYGWERRGPLEFIEGIVHPRR